MTQQRFILQEVVSVSKRKPSSVVDRLRDFLKTFEKATKCLQNPLLKHKIEIGSTESKDNLFGRYYNDIIENPNRQKCLSFRFENNNSCVFSIKKFELQGNHFFLTETANLNHRQIHHLYKNDITLKTSVK